MNGFSLVRKQRILTGEMKLVGNTKVEVDIPRWDDVLVV